MCSLRHPIRGLLPTYPISHRPSDRFKCLASPLLLLFFSHVKKKGQKKKKKASWYINPCSVIWNIMWPFSPPPPGSAACLRSLQTTALRFPAIIHAIAFPPIGCPNSYKRLKKPIAATDFYRKISPLSTPGLKEQRLLGG